ncbi:hypothetical protein [Streptomyces sp. GQFP]|uniref:hypothetical protein n=1 Tax=Streptomyces sp. GQFP TaxID=2907545 RepID=UPI001F26CDC9|nr:hypothetical protein [Streptomyces sp. GQFP]UIX29796.1 hypothetical protein LUX31_06940 [Streptomyces sp. GQFP]
MRVPPVSRRHQGRALGGAVLALAALAGVLTLVGPSAGDDSSPAEFRPEFPQRGLVTNEFAYWHPDAPGARHSPDWTMTSGSLFGLDGAGWSGRPDGERPDAESSKATDSAVFRLASRRRDFGGTRVTLRLRVDDLITTDRTPAHAYDGVHLWLRFHSEQECYAVSMARRDGEVAVKRKTPGGPSNGGTYVTLAVSRAELPQDTWVDVLATVTDLPDRRVRITLDLAGRRVLDVTDEAPGGLIRPGGVGIRGDNAAFRFRDFTARPE